MLPTQALEFLFKDKDGNGYGVVNTPGKTPTLNLDRGMSYTFTQELSEPMNVGDKLYFNSAGTVTQIVRNYTAKKKTKNEGTGCVARKIYI